MKRIIFIGALFLAIPLISSHSAPGQDQGLHLGQGDTNPGRGHGRGRGRRPPTVPEWPVSVLYGSGAVALGLGYFLLSRKQKKPVK